MPDFSGRQEMRPLRQAGTVSTEAAPLGTAQGRITPGGPTVGRAASVGGNALREPSWRVGSAQTR